MAENDFKTAEDLYSYARDLKDKFNRRDKRLLRSQELWQMPITSSETGRTIYVNNEPWTATRLIVALLTQGRYIFKATSPLDDPNYDAKESKRALNEVERLLKAHYTNVDMQLWRRRKGDYIRQIGYHLAVYGWHAGINLVNDLSNRNWPIFSDIWSPLDTFPDMDGGTALVHAQRMSMKEIQKSFGPKRPGGKVKGYDFYPSTDRLKPSDKLEVVEYLDEESNMIIVVDDNGKPYTLKDLVDHDLGHNPAWCNPLDNVPFRHSLSGSGKDLTADPESDAWMEYIGQAPILGYETAHRAMTELANQIADVVERWAEARLIVHTRDGRLADIDLTKPLSGQLEPGESVDIIKIPTFPADERAFMEIYVRDIEKASFPRVAYGAVGSTEAAYTLQLMKAASGYIIEPIVDEAQKIIEYGANSIIEQLSRRGAQYSKSFPVRMLDKRGSAKYDWIKVNSMPPDTLVAVTIKGAGVPEDKWQALLAATNAANARQPVIPLETLIDEYLERDDPPGEMAKMMWERLQTSAKALDLVSSPVTLLGLADGMAERDNPRLQEVSKYLYAMAYKSMEDLFKQTMMAGEEAPPVGPGQPLPLPPGMEPPLPQGQPGLDGSAQVAGAPPIGAPPPGSTLPPTGPDPTRGLLMQAALQQGV